LISVSFWYSPEPEYTFLESSLALPLELMGAELIEMLVALSVESTTSPS
jgi:hypothetical protein